MNLRLNIAALAFGALLVSGCRPVLAPVVPSTEPAAEAQPTTEPAAEVEAQPITISFAMKAGDQDAHCDETVEGLGTTGSPVTFNDLRFYVANLHLINNEGEVFPVTLEQDGLWQTENVALLDFEDASAGCADSGTPETNTTVRATIPSATYVCPECAPVAIVFDLGVPFALNHQDVTVAASPLNLPPMWWNWQGGYKFVRIDMKTDAASTDGAWFIHLGSTGCKAADQATPPTEPCARPNVATVRLDGYDPAKSVIVADIASLLADVNLSESTPQPAGCMSGPDDPDCANLMPAFGLDPATGVCAEAGCPAQKFFRIE